MRSVKEILKLSSKFLENRVSNPRFSAEVIISKVLSCKRLDLYLNFEKPLLESELKEIKKYLKRRAKGEPLEYIFPKIEFYNVDINLNRDVLIPRCETEILVDIVCKKINRENLKVLDLCTGSGAIAISLKKRFPYFKVWASDISQKAIEVAKKNSIKNGVEIIFKVGDLLKPLDEKFDIIVCNPPYVSYEEYKELPRDIKYEPPQALLAKDNGFEFYKRLKKDLPFYLEKKAKVFFEIGKDQKNSLLKLFSSNFWKKKEVLKDFSNKDRFFLLEVQ